MSDKRIVSKIKNSYNSIIKRQSNFKMGKGSEQTFFFKEVCKGPVNTQKDAQHHLSWGNANQNHNEILRHTPQDGYNKKRQ